MPLRFRTSLLASAIAVAGVGCAQPVTVRITPMESVPATVRLDLLAGSESASPSECSTPCDVTLQPGTRHALVVQADGYYPARVDIDHIQAARTASALGRNPVPLMLPLVKRSESADSPTPEAVLERLPEPQPTTPEATPE